jgi:lantibiotic leader peptide-processing serine protease
LLRYIALLSSLLFCSLTACSIGSFPSPLTETATAETIAPDHYVLVYRANLIPAGAEASIARSGARLTARLDRFGIATVVSTDPNAATLLAALPNVALVLHDRYITAHAIQTVKPSIIASSGPPPTPTYDTDYTSPQGWAVQQAGGFGDNIPNNSQAPATGPWNTTLGAGVRIAILDSGIDANHLDLAPNLALNLSEINQISLPSPCDNGSPQDQQGHGTFTASLAAAALGPGTGLTIGLAPQATLLNIKVLERLPATSAATPTAACEAGQATGLLSWVIEGIDDAVANHANVISLSLGTLVDLTTGDGAGWKSTFNAVTYTASQSGVTIVAALGNDSLNLNSTLIELPAESRNVLPVAASTNPACAENLTPNATCIPGPITLASYSNFGAPNTLAAPGGSYPEASATGVSGFVRGACSSGLTNTTDGLPANGQSFGCFNLGHTPYIQAIGTSAAAPLVAAAAALLHAVHPNWTPTQIIAALLTTATHLPNSSTPELNLLAALTQ